MFTILKKGGFMLWKLCIEVDLLFCTAALSLRNENVAQMLQPYFFCLLDLHLKSLSLCELLQMSPETGARVPSCGQIRKCTIMAYQWQILHTENTVFKGT